MTSVLVADSILNASGTQRPEFLINQGEYTLGKTIYEADCTTYATSSSRSFVDLKTWSNQTGFSPNGVFEFYYHIPCRNDGGWGGAYTEVQISYDDGSTWYGLGNSGFDGGVMMYEGNNIHYYNNLMMIYPEQTSEYTARFKFRFCAYSNTIKVNGSHDINGRRTGGMSYFQNESRYHCMHYTLKEWVPMN